MKLLTLPRAFSRRISTGKVIDNVCGWPKPDYGPMEVQRSELMNGIRVAAAKPMGSYMAACTIMFQAGSRYEIDDQIGATHFLRAISSCTGCAYTAFAKNRHLQQNGASLTCTSDRQSISYTLRCPPTVYPELKYYLLDAATRCCFLNWEIDDRRALIREDLHRIPPEQRLMDILQSVMWCGPLSNSMFCVEERIDSMTADALDCFVKTNFRTDCCSVASVGVPFEETLKLAEKIEARRERPAPRCHMLSCARKGFEYYDLGRCSDTYIALGVPGCGTCDITNLLKHAIIAAACGVGPLAMGQHSTDNTPQPPLGMMVGGDPHTFYKAFNISYAETGIFGIVAKSRASVARMVTQGAAEFLANVGELNFKQIDIGKKRLKVNMCLNDNNCVNSSESLALQLANSVQLDNCACTLGLIESISNDEICCTARRLSHLSPCTAVAVVGDIGEVPHDQFLVHRI
ncbi:cytochrome b-c1 complex subunit 2, mitochondrial-like [Plodia interpunctella]|uniref:cytochrome b-c1 complex subunit 2, mitochondrial-like n=1 Tax=Plodia interpunctella TaxID=58824 RepID=UPI0023684DFD|nr:cytochrome b-c1 complex subunit 2, mitochondrial-like [Plodia interpunctella]